MDITCSASSAGTGRNAYPHSCPITLYHHGVTVSAVTCQSVPLATQGKVGCSGFHYERLGCCAATINERRIAVGASVLLTRLDTDHSKTILGSVSRGRNGRQASCTISIRSRLRVTRGHSSSKSPTSILKPGESRHLRSVAMSLNSYIA
jgi:hypothetical protein